MLERKREREAENYTFFFGRLTEDEQMYRDYYETDLEKEPEIEELEDHQDNMFIAQEEHF
jgi:hypothetical protein